MTCTIYILAPIGGPRIIPQVKGLMCRGGHSGFWANWKGELMSCAMITEPKKSMLEYSFAECWESVVKGCEQHKPCEKCVQCDKYNLCHTCFGACFAETGSTEQAPEYLCQVTEAYIELLKQYAKGQFMKVNERNEENAGS